MPRLVRGRLADASSAPERGERIEELVQVENLVVEQILSGELYGPADYVQDQDEFVLLLAGSAALDVDGQEVDLDAGDWLLLPRRTPHRVVRTEPGTSWLALHLHHQ